MNGCNGLWRTGTDIGTSTSDMDLLHEEAPGLVFARSTEKGGAGDSGPWTALGVFCAIEATLAWLDGREGEDAGRGGSGASTSPVAGRGLDSPHARPVAGRVPDMPAASPIAGQPLTCTHTSAIAGR